MIKKINIILIFLFSLLLISCGYKKINHKETSINIESINVTGDNRIAYNLKNDINLITNENSENVFRINLKIIKQVNNKIKDATGKITRFNLTINGDLILTNVKTLEEINKSFSKNGDYDVAENHSDTIKNEKQATKNVTRQLSEEVINFIILIDKNK
tara:strand:+ start:730 stop:1203 length:474 start_codon:yes stop_codon:yes gene_type:complete